MFPRRVLRDRIIEEKEQLDMSEEPQTTESSESTEEKEPAWYRDQLAKKDQELEELRKQANKQKVQLMEGAFEEVGLDPSKGVGKAVAEKYDGDPDPEAIRQFAVDEYQWEPPASSEGASAVSQAQGRVSGAVNEATSTQVSPVDIQIQEAMEKGDFVTSTQLKVQKFREEQGI